MTVIIDTTLNMIMIRSGITLKFFIMVITNLPPNRRAIKMAIIAENTFPLNIPYEEATNINPEMTPAKRDGRLPALK